jgi:MFS family permease
MREDAANRRRDPATLAGGPLTSAALPRPAYPPRRAAYAAIALLMLASLVSYLDRQLLTLLVDPIKADLHISDTKIGLLQGFSFALFFSIMAMPLGLLVDRTLRWRIVAAGITLWSLATIASGLVRSFEALLVCRMLVGIGEASLMPAAFSMLADYFPPHQRGRAYGVFTLSVFAGGGGALLLGGAILRALGNTAFIDLGFLGGTRAVWQAAFVVVGLPGLLVAAAAAAMREPVRIDSAAIAAEGGQPQSLIRYLRMHRVPFFWVWTGYSFMSFAAFSVLPWIPAFLSRTYALTPAAAGAMTGSLQMAGGIIGALVAGVLGDRWTWDGRRGGKFRLIFIFLVIGPVSLTIFALTGHLGAAAAALFVFSVANAISYASGPAAIQDMVPSSLRGRVTAFWYLVTGILGVGAGPMGTALASDYLYPSAPELGNAMLTAAIPAFALGLLCALAAVRSYDKLRRGLVSA